MYMKFWLKHCNVYTWKPYTLAGFEPGIFCSVGCRDDHSGGLPLFLFFCHSEEMNQILLTFHNFKKNTDDVASLKIRGVNEDQAYRADTMSKETFHRRSMLQWFWWNIWRQNCQNLTQFDFAIYAEKNDPNLCFQGNHIFSQIRLKFAENCDHYNDPGIRVHILARLLGFGS
jgi:hypothetical protein